MSDYLRAYWYIVTRYRTYRPKKIKLRFLRDWLVQFPSSIRADLLKLLCNVIYFSESDTRKNLLLLNDRILERLSTDGVTMDRVIYAQIDKAGSSSPVMLNMLRDAANLERKGCKFVDSKDVDTIHQFTSELKSGAIIYVDDFAGTGKQFTRNRNWSADYIVGSFSEFFIAPCICEEAMEKMREVSVSPFTSFVHTKAQRPLHTECVSLEPTLKAEFSDLCHKIHPQFGLGFDKLATMVVFYRNAPNTMPLIFRGNLGQNPIKGIFPRFDDLPWNT